MTIRRATTNDLLRVQQCNLHCLPENYQMRYYLYHAVIWPQLPQVAVDEDGTICGYVLGKLDEEAPVLAAHVTSIAVFRSHRQLAIATKLIRATQREMRHVMGAIYVSLHVRVSNTAAIHLYQDVCGFRVVNIEVKYYADGEDAYEMRCYLYSWQDHGAFINRDGTVDPREGTIGRDGRLSFPDAVIKERDRKAYGAPRPPPLLEDLADVPLPPIVRDVTVSLDPGSCPLREVSPCPARPKHRTSLPCYTFSSACATSIYTSSPPQDIPKDDKDTPAAARKAAKGKRK